MSKKEKSPTMIMVAKKTKNDELTRFSNENHVEDSDEFLYLPNSLDSEDEGKNFKLTEKIWKEIYEKSRHPVIYEEMF